MNEQTNQQRTGPTVWIVYNDSRKDFSKAENYGQLRDVFSSIGRNYDGQTALEYARHVLSQSSPEDYLLMVGDPALCAICAIAMAELNEEMSILRWDRERFQYTPLLLDFA